MLRLLQRADLHTLASLLAHEHPAAQGARSSLRRVIFSDPDFDPALCLCAWSAETDRAEAVACAVQRAQKGFVKLLYVAPDRRRRGLGCQLLASLEQRMRARGVLELEIDGAAPAYFRPGLLASDEASRAFFSARAFEVVGERFSLRLALPSPLDPACMARGVREAGFRLRRARPAESTQLGATIGHHFSPAWAIEAQLGLEDSPSALHVALRGDDFAGFACSGLPGPCVFGPMGVLPSYRGHGLGAALLAHSLDDIGSRGCEEALISWIGPEHFYSGLLGPLERVRFLVLRKDL